MSNHMYHLICVNDRTERKEYMSLRPMTHAEGCTMLSKQVPPRSKDVRFLLEDADVAARSDRTVMNGTIDLEGGIPILRTPIDCTAEGDRRFLEAVEMSRLKNKTKTPR